LAAEGLFAASRKRPLPRIPALIGLVTGNDAAAKRDVLTSITTRFPPARILVAETYVQGPRAAPAIATAIGDLCSRGVDVIVLAHEGLGRGARRVVERHRQRLALAHECHGRAPLLALERRAARLESTHGRLRTLSPRATLERGYAIVRAGEQLAREPPAAGS